MPSIGARGRPIGRKSLCSPEVTQVVADGIREGLPFKLACERAGIADVTGYAWIRKADEEDKQGKAETPCVAFRREVSRARTDLFQSLVRTVKTAAKKDWRAASWILERRDPDAWSRRTEVTGADGGPVAVADLTAQIDAALKARSARDLGIPAGVLALPDPTVLDGELAAPSPPPIRSPAARPSRVVPDVTLWTVDADEGEDERQEARKARRSRPTGGKGRF